MDNELWRWVWVAVTMVMGVGEIFTAGFFLLPFALGAALAAAAAWLDLHGAVQWLLFFGGTAVSMLVLRRFIGRQDRPDDLPVGANRYIGMEARVIEDIDLVANTGRVRVESDEWRAVAENGPVAEGSLVRVTALHGTKLDVEVLERHSLLGGGVDQAGANQVEVSVGNSQLVAEDRIAGESEDTLDVSSAGGNSSGDSSEVRRTDPDADDRDDGEALGWSRCGVDDLEIDVEPLLPSEEEEIADRRLL